MQRKKPLGLLALLGALFVGLGVGKIYTHLYPKGLPCGKFEVELCPRSQWRFGMGEYVPAVASWANGAAPTGPVYGSEGPWIQVGPLVVRNTWTVLLYEGTKEKPKKRTYRSFSLGRENVVLELEQYEDSEQVVQLRVSTGQDTREVGESYREELQSGLYSFLPGREKQLFVTGRLGAIHTHVLAVDPHTGKLRELYGRDSLRVEVTPIRNPLGYYDLKERWGKRQWFDGPSRGKAVTDLDPSSVYRILRWNGKAFIPLPKRAAASVLQAGE